MPNIYLETFQKQFNQAIESYKKNISSLRTGRANTGLIEEVMVECYGSSQPIKQLASLSIPENTSIAIAPWDKTILKDIEVAINKAGIGMSVVNTGDKLIAKLPMMTEENRKEMVKVLGKKTEESRVEIRQVRDEIKNMIIEGQKSKDISEDDKYQFLSELDEMTGKLNEQLESLRAAKEKEIMTV